MEPNAQATAEQHVGLQLPVGIVSSGDVMRLKRELTALENDLEQMRLRTSSPISKLPRSSRLLEEFAATNRLNLLLPDDRQRMAAYLANVVAHAPVIHISFAAEASRKFTTEIILWFRHNIHREVLLNIGIEPNLAAGCMLRTTNKQFDLSLRAHFAKQAGALAEKLKAGA